MNKTRGSGHAGSALAVVMLMIGAVGCDPSGRGEENTQTLADRFVQQVNDDDCDAPSGSKQADEGPWADACHAAVERVGPDTTLELPTTDWPVYDDDAVWVGWDVVVPYDDQNGEPARFVLGFAGNGAIRKVDWPTEAVFGAGDMSEWVGADVADLAAVQELVDGVEDSLADGRCDDVVPLLAPADVFPSAADGVDCEAMAAVLGPVAAYTPGPWHTSVQSASEAPEPIGVTRKADELDLDYFQRVVRQHPDSYRVVTKTAFDPPVGNRRYAVSIVSYEGEWYLLNVHLDDTALRFNWP